jgi:biopolymer transport protein ExbD
VLEFAPEEHETPRIDISALVDVVFLLIIFFVISTTFVVSTGLTVRPPASSTAPSSAPGLEVVVARDGSVAVGETTLAAEEVPGRLPGLVQQMLEERGEPRRVVVRGDEGVTYGVLFRALDAVREAGVEAFVLATRPAPPPADQP